MTEIISRADAIARGQTRYFTRRPCSRGHVAERYCATWTCVDCVHEHHRRYYAENPEKYRRKSKQSLDKRRVEDPDFYTRARAADRERDRTPERKAWAKAYRAHADRKEAKRKYDRLRRANPEVRSLKREQSKTDTYRARRNEYEKRRRTSDPNYKLALDLRVRLNQALKRVGLGKASAVKLLGCSVSEARAHIEKQFLPGMSWGNHSRSGWHIDHIRPLASFNLTIASELAAACHYSNLQPLWAFANISKGARAQLLQDNA